MQFIYISPIEPFTASHLQPVQNVIASVFEMESKIMPATFKSEIAYDFSREQYKSTTLLKGILNIIPEDALKIVGFTNVDLFVPVLTFVFGEAQLNGKAAIVSIARLKNEFYGLPKNEEFLISRLRKEIVHELGHTFGLYHCPKYDCVMNSSMYVENTDLKSENFCNDCRKVLNTNLLNK